MSSWRSMTAQEHHSLLGGIAASLASPRAAFVLAGCGLLLAACRACRTARAPAAVATLARTSYLRARISTLMTKRAVIAATEPNLD